MQTHLIAIVMVVLAACSATDSVDVGTQCQTTNYQCTTDLSCSNFPPASCGEAGFCVVCGTEPLPDAGQTTCTAPPPMLQCQIDLNCGNYPGSVCGPDNFCVCPQTSCTQPPPNLQCTVNGGCSNYPGSTCGVDGFCHCP